LLAGVFGRDTESLAAFAGDPDDRCSLGGGCGCGLHGEAMAALEALECLADQDVVDARLLAALGASGGDLGWPGRLGH
jgi:hypothetical protein